MFCTGGIRCEKAGPYMESQGFRNVLQLDGGILKYFEECGGAHYRGECFVFDQRVGVDPALQETDAAQCFKCLSPLTAAEQQDARYVPGRSCPWCHRTRGRAGGADAAAAQPGHPRGDASAARQHSGRQISARFECRRNAMGWRCSTTFCRLVGHLPAGYWEEECRAGNLLDSRHQVLAATHIVRAGERLLHRLPHAIEPAVNGDVDRAARGRGADRAEQARAAAHACGRPLHAQHACSRYSTPSIARRSRRPAHRLDANTTGLVIVSAQPAFRRAAAERSSRRAAWRRPTSCACRGSAGG